jgi:N utilization substance protein B
LAEADPALFADIVRGAADDRERLDSNISAALTPDWPLARLDSVLRAILRAGAYELLHRPDVPPRVSISEYTAIAYAFFTGKEPGLANGLLDRLARLLRAEEL